MKEWNESDWFKNWIAIARQGQNAMRRAEGLSEIPLPLVDRQPPKPVESAVTERREEWQVTE